MSEHEQMIELLPFYVSGELRDDQRMLISQHLSGCAACQADLALWQSVALEVTTQDQLISAPADLAVRALEQVATRPSWEESVLGGLQRMLLLLRSQMPLVHREIWPASALVIALGYIAAIIADHAGFLYTIAPLVAAACLSLIYGPENDPAYELSLTTPTSPRQILLARLVLVFGYNLVLLLVAFLGLLPVFEETTLGTLALAWLAPMTFLSALALVLSLWVGATNAITVSYTAWIVQILVGPLRLPLTDLQVSPLIFKSMAAYQQFWQAPELLLLCSAALFAAAVWLAGRRNLGLLTPV